MAGYHHGHPFRNAAPYHVPASRSSEIVKEPVAKLRLLAGGAPRLAEVFHLVGSILIGEHIGEQGSALLAPLPLLLNHVLQFGIKIQRPAIKESGLLLGA